MPDTFSSNLLLTLMTNGEHNNTWNDVYGANATTVDNKFGSLTTVNTTGGNTTLSSGQEIVATLRVTGALISDANMIFSGRKGFWNVSNETTGNFAVICKVSGQTGIILQANESAVVWCDGTDIRKLKKTPKAPTTLVDGATVNVDCRLNDRFYVVATASRSFVMQNPTDQQAVIIYHKASGGDYTPSFDASVEFGTSLPNVVATLNGKTDVIGLVYFSTLAKWLPLMQMQGWS